MAVCMCSVVGTDTATIVRLYTTLQELNLTQVQGQGNRDIEQN